MCWPSSSSAEDLGWRKINPVQTVKATADHHNPKKNVLLVNKPVWTPTAEFAQTVVRVRLAKMRAKPTVKANALVRVMARAKVPATSRAKAVDRAMAAAIVTVEGMAKAFDQ